MSGIEVSSQRPVRSEGSLLPRASDAAARGLHVSGLDAARAHEPGAEGAARPRPRRRHNRAWRNGRASGPPGAGACSASSRSQTWQEREAGVVVRVGRQRDGGPRRAEWRQHTARGAFTGPAGV